MSQAENETTTGEQPATAFYALVAAGSLAFGQIVLGQLRHRLPRRQHAWAGLVFVVLGVLLLIAGAATDSVELLLAGGGAALAGIVDQMDLRYPPRKD